MTVLLMNITIPVSCDVKNVLWQFVVVSSEVSIPNEPKLFETFDTTFHSVTSTVAPPASARAYAVAQRCYSVIFFSSTTKRRVRERAWDQ